MKTLTTENINSLRRFFLAAADQEQQAMAQNIAAAGLSNSLLLLQQYFDAVPSGPTNPRAIAMALGPEPEL